MQAVPSSIESEQSVDEKAIQLINKLFPDEKSLLQLDDVLFKLRFKNEKLDQDIHNLMRHGASGADFDFDSVSSSTRELDKAKKATQELFQKIKNIKEKAAQSEKMVHEITKDIKSLDQAKKHLTSSITVLKRCQMLVNALDQVTEMVKRKQFGDMTQMIQAVIELMTFFNAYENVPKIQQLMYKSKLLITEVKEKLFKEIEGSFSSQGAFVGSSTIIHDAISIVDLFDQDYKYSLSLFHNSRNKVIDFYCDLQLRDYRALFSQSEISTLENTSRRYGWLKKILKTFEDEHSLFFPPSFNIAEILCEKFCVDTKRDMIDLLLRTADELDVKQLIKTLKETLSFESQLSKKFSKRDSISTESDEAQMIPSRFYRIISACFEPYLTHYIQAEEKQITQIIQSSEDKIEENVYSLSTELFLLYKQSLTHCVSISTKKPLLDLSRVFAKYVMEYANRLLALTKNFEDSNSLGSIQNLAIIINTADYCHKTVGQLEEKMKEKIDSEYKESISFEKEKEVLLSIINASIRAWIKLCDSTCEQSFNSMLKMNWSSIAAVGDQSSYVTEFVSATRSMFLPLQNTIISEKYFRSICDRYVDQMSSKWLQNVYKCKTISDYGAEQLLLDMQAIKSLLLEIPKQFSDEIPTSYSKMVHKGMGKIETILKCIMTPLDPIDGMIENYLLLNADPKVTTFQKILDLKGLKKSEQPLFVELLQKRTNSTSLAVTTNTTAEANVPSPIPVPPPPPPMSARINENLKRFAFTMGLKNNASK